MADERLQIEISAADKASPVLRQVAASAKQEMKAVGDATGQVATASQGAFASVAAGAKKVEVGAKGIAKEVKAVGTASTQAAGVTGGAFGQMTAYAEKHKAALLGVAAAVTALGAVQMQVAKDSVAAFNEAEAAEVKLGLAIRNAGQGVSQSNLDKLAEDLMDVTTYDDEATKGMMAFLASAKLNEAQIKQLAPAMLDLAEFMGKDLEGSAKMLAYTLETGNVAGLKRLKIAVDEAKFAMDPVGALVEAITAKCGGMAVMVGQTLGGQLLILKNQTGEVKEAIGGDLAPALKDITQTLIPLVKGIGDFAKEHPSITRAAIATGALATAVASIGVMSIGAIIGIAKIKKEFIELGIAAKLSANTVTASAAEMAAATTAAGAAAGAGGAAVGAGSAIGGAAAVAGGAAAGGAAARLGLRGVLGAAGRVAGRYVLPAYLAYEGISYGLNRWGSKAEQEAAAIESGATETPEEKALLKANQARWAAARAGIRPVAKQSFAEQQVALGRAEIGPDLAAIPTEEFLDVDGIAQASKATSMELASLVGDAVSAPVLEMLEAAPDLLASTLDEQFAVGVAGITPLGKGAFAFPAGPARSGQPAGAGAGIPVSGDLRGIVISQSDLPDGGREILVRFQIPGSRIAPGLLSDGVTDWIGDLQYAGEG